MPTRPCPDEPTEPRRPGKVAGGAAVAVVLAVALVMVAAIQEGAAPLVPGAELGQAFSVPLQGAPKRQPCDGLDLPLPPAPIAGYPTASATAHAPAPISTAPAAPGTVDLTRYSF